MRSNAKPDVQEIMKQIKEKIAKRKGSAEVEMETEIFSRLKEGYDIRSKRIITSHRKLIGHLLVKTRKLLHEEIMRAVDPIIRKQIDFNLKMLNSLDRLNKKIDGIAEKKKGK